MTAIDVHASLAGLEGLQEEDRGLSTLARALQGSEILKIAYAVRALASEGHDVLNLTVGDFNSSAFPIPSKLRDGITTALADGHSNYPPATGVLECRQAIRDLIERRLGLNYPVDAVLVVNGARPAICGAYLALLDEGEKVVFGVPSWNNHYYCTMVGAQSVAVPTRADHNFFPRVEDIEPHLADARLLCLNSPLNPTGTVIDPDELARIGRMVLDENRRRQDTGQRPLYVLFDQVYWLLVFGDARHSTPVHVNPELAKYTIIADAISKGFAATGLRVGWAVGPQDVLRKMGALLTHTGAWAPRAEQVATAALLNDDTAIDTYLAGMKEEVVVRLRMLEQAVQSVAELGWPAKAIAPQGAIYLSIRLDLKGATRADGRVIESDEDTRQFLLEEAGVALLPFRCFGLEDADAWFRASVGAVTRQECATVRDRMHRALATLRRPG
ncbi:MAG: aminotransferase class I/II-fold pyridoxal phosphate-dependent enzyme [Myxococcota bacterium]